MSARIQDQTAASNTAQKRKPDRALETSLNGENQRARKINEGPARLIGTVLVRWSKTNGQEKSKLVPALPQTKIKCRTVDLN
jgi:hypothetical protein